MYTGFVLFSFLIFISAQSSEPQVYNPTLPQPTIKSSLSSAKKTVVLPLNEDEKSPEPKSYQVQRGDTLWKISKDLKIPVAEIKRLNGLKNDTIQIGQRLIIEGNPMEIRRAIAVEKLSPPPEFKVSDLTPPPVAEIHKAPPSSVSPEKSPAFGITNSPTISPSTPPSTPVVKSNEAEAPKAVPPTISLKERFLVEIRKMIADRVSYNSSWRPEGSDRSWIMDCSNTTRYLFYKIFKIDIGRTASEQYYRLKVKGRAWDVPLDGNGRADIDYLHSNLKVGDLLFWEHTYSPDREPPITHVTVYLGMDEEGRFLMAGSEQGKGLIDRGFNGPDLYYFNPLAQKGGHRQFLFFGWRPGRFVAHGRPLPE